MSSVIDKIINNNKAKETDKGYATTAKDAIDNGIITENEGDYYYGLAKIIERSSHFYTVGLEQKNVTISLSEDNTGSCDKRGNINLPISLLKEFKDNNLPDFTVFYHELGHHKYSNKLWKLLDCWKQNGRKLQMAGIPQWDEKYFYLLNWIEDFYIEDKIVQHYPYLQNIVGCLRKLSVSYNELDINYFFHYLYRHRQLQPNFPKQKEFNLMWNKLLSLRNANNFGGLISNFLTSTNSTLLFIQEFLKLYNFCIQEGILKDVYQPPLTTPAHANQSNGQQGQQVSGTTSSSHSGQVGTTQVLPTNPQGNLQIFTKELEREVVQVGKALSSDYIETKSNSLDGLFTADKELCQQIAEPIIPNFFNQRRLEDRTLFKQPGRTFNNVSIYRDISGSTHHGNIHELMDKVCRKIIENIPIDYHFYLYCSGNVSILECNYVKWIDYTVEPNEYKSNPIFKQFGGGTNSDAIADVISEQYSDQWLNIIVTDGDLNALMGRDNIKSLLNNVAVIVVDPDKLDEIPQQHQVNVEKDSDLNDIIPMLLSFINE